MTKWSFAKMTGARIVSKMNGRQRFRISSKVTTKDVAGARHIGRSGHGDVGVDDGCRPDADEDIQDGNVKSYDSVDSLFDALRQPW